jgi:hypothetical protein
MDRIYFERLHREEARHAEWRRLDQALQARTKSQHRSIRVMFGRWLIRAGAALANETVISQPKPFWKGR